MVQKRRGRPREYDHDTALAQAMELFWERGFTATSLDELGAAMGMNRPSMYAAFGDKHELFVKALELYRDAGRSALPRLLDPERPLLASLRAVFSMLLATYLSGEEGPRGCMMFTVAAAEATKDPVIRALVTDATRTFDAAFEGRFEVARTRGELAATADPVALAKLASGLVHTLAVRACSGEKKSSLEGVIDVFLRALCGSRSFNE
jgi:AcrR family transcriptional regulator